MTGWPGWFCISSTKMLLLCLCASGNTSQHEKPTTYMFIFIRFQLYCGFSGQVMIDQMYLMLFNLFFTSLPPVTSLSTVSAFMNYFNIPRLLWEYLTEMPLQTSSLPPLIYIPWAGCPLCTNLTASGSTWLMLSTSLWSSSMWPLEHSMEVTWGCGSLEHFSALSASS